MPVLEPRDGCPECGGPVTFGTVDELLFAMETPQQRASVMAMSRHFGRRSTTWLCALCEAFGVRL